MPGPVVPATTGPHDDARPLAAAPTEETRPMAHPASTLRRPLAVLALSIGLLALPGCLVSSTNWSEVEGTPITFNALDRVVVGETTEDWVLGTFGDPSSRTDLEDGTTILRYESRETRSGRGSVFLLLKASSRKTTTSRTIFEIRDGVVCDWWVEKAGG